MFIHKVLLFAMLVIPAGAEDAAVVNPKIVKIEFENQHVRILRAHYAPHERLEMHSHPAKAEVQITDGVVRIFTPGGKWLDDPGKAGEFFWLVPTRHAVENVGSAPLELAEIEMKNVTAKSIPVGAPSRSQAPSNEPLPVEQEPPHRWEFQNQYVRVLDVLLAPGDSTLFHTHSHDSIAVQLSEATIQQQVFEKNWQAALKLMPGNIRYAEGAKMPYTHRLKVHTSTQERGDHTLPRHRH